MTETNTAGLSFQDAAAEAQAEADAETQLASTEASGETVISSDLGSGGSEGEQPAVENTESTSLFSGADGGESGNEQSPLADSALIDVNGKQVSVSELRSGYMRQADYTQKTQEIAEKERNADKALALYQALQDKPQETARALWQRVSQGQEPAQISEQAPASADIDALVERQVAERLDADPRLQALDQERALRKVNTTFDEIEELYTVKLNDDDRRHVLQKAQDAGTGDLSLVFGGLYQEKLMLDKQRQNVAESATSSSQHPEASADKPEPEKFGSFREAMTETLREEGLSDSQMNTIVSQL